MMDKKKRLDLAAAKASCSILDCISITCSFLNNDCSGSDKEEIAAKMEVLLGNKIRSSQIYAMLMWYTVEVMNITGFGEDVPMIWSYLEKKIAPFIDNLFNGNAITVASVDKTGKSGICNQLLNNMEAIFGVLTKREIAYGFKETIVKGVKCIAIAYSTVAIYLTRAGWPWREGDLLRQLRSLDGIKTRLRFLSEDSNLDYFKSEKGFDKEGKSVMRQCVCVPVQRLPPAVVLNYYSDQTQSQEFKVQECNKLDEAIEKDKVIEQNEGNDQDDVVEQGKTKKQEETNENDQLNASTVADERIQAEPSQCIVVEAIVHPMPKDKLYTKEEEEVKEVVQKEVNATTNLKSGNSKIREISTLHDGLHPGEVLGKRRRTKKQRH